MKIVGYQIFLRITRFVTLVIRPDYQTFCLRSTPVDAYNYLLSCIMISFLTTAGSVRVTAKDATDKCIEFPMREWFRTAKDRNCGRSKRRLQEAETAAAAVAATSTTPGFICMSNVYIIKIKNFSQIILLLCFYCDVIEFTSFPFNSEFTEGNFMAKLNSDYLQNMSRHHTCG